MTATTLEGGSAPARASSKYSYVWVAGLCVFIALAGFAPTFWMPMAARTLKVNPIVYIHGFAMTGWTLFLLTQSWMVATGNMRRHRALGMVGISFATAVVILGLLVAMNSIKIAPPDVLPRQLAFAVVPLTGIAYFAVLVVIAFANTHKPEVHKRLLFTATIFALSAAVARWFMVALAPPGAVGPPPVEMTLLPSAVVDIILIGLMIADWRTRGSVHKTYLIAVPIGIAIQVLAIPLSKTGAWINFATWYGGLAG